jgi:hypothetical protein
VVSASSLSSTSTICIATQTTPFIHPGRHRPRRFERNPGCKLYAAAVYHLLRQWLLVSIRRTIAKPRHHAFDYCDLSMTRDRRTIVMMRETATAKDCPLAPPANSTVYARTLHRACLVLGGVQQLARHLEVSEESLRPWITGEAEPPEPVFIACVEIVLLHAAGSGRAN